MLSLLKKVYKGLKAPFQFEPVKQTGSYTHSHLNTGQGYQKAFSAYPGRKITWDIEKEIISTILSGDKSIDKHLDFAAGTGRIAKYLEDFCNQQYLLDVSAEMLSVARNNLKNAVLFQRNFKDGLPEVEDNSVDLITAFRFFPNAEPELRNSAMKFICTKVKQNGLVICNNHRNFWSIPYLMRRLTFSGGIYGMTNKDMINLANKNGLTLARYFSNGIIPQSEKMALLPWKLTEYIEKTTFQLFGERHRLGYNVVFVFKLKE
ncbi:MAG: class I SAM-dependent methyltransferase [Gammaproteobacteria bacterium]|nr:class I SAM-dependent methyltransferase [Gammaproteobacteria bacterium]